MALLQNEKGQEYLVHLNIHIIILNNLSLFGIQTISPQQSNNEI